MGQLRSRGYTTNLKYTTNVYSMRYRVVLALMLGCMPHETHIHARARRTHAHTHTHTHTHTHRAFVLSNDVSCASQSIRVELC
jgi:hypothetical protein